MQAFPVSVHKQIEARPSEYCPPPERFFNGTLRANGQGPNPWGGTMFKFGNQTQMYISVTGLTLTPSNLAAIIVFICFLITTSAILSDKGKTLLNRITVQLAFKFVTLVNWGTYLACALGFVAVSMCYPNYLLVFACLCALSMLSFQENNTGFKIHTFKWRPSMLLIIGATLMCAYTKIQLAQIIYDKPPAYKHKGGDPSCNKGTYFLNANHHPRDEDRLNLYGTTPPWDPSVINQTPNAQFVLDPPIPTSTLLPRYRYINPTNSWESGAYAYIHLIRVVMYSLFDLPRGHNLRLGQNWIKIQRHTRWATKRAHTLFVLRTGGDGNCFYRAMSTWINALDSTKITPVTVKKHMMELIKCDQDEDKFAKALKVETPKGVPNSPNQPTTKFPLQTYDQHGTLVPWKF